MRAAATLFALRHRWGSFYLFLFALLTPLFFIPFINRHPGAYAGFVHHPYLRYILLTGDLFAFALCFTSFAKIYRFRLFLLGHLMACLWLLYFYLNFAVFPDPSAWYSASFLKSTDFLTVLRILTLVKMAALVFAAAVPSTLRYRLGQVTALALTAAAALIFLCLLYYAPRPIFGEFFKGAPPYYLTLYGLAIAVFALPALFPPEENAFGSALAGLALFQLLFAHHIGPETVVTAKFLLFLEPWVVSGIAVLFWFSCLHLRVAYDPLLKIYNRDYAHAIIRGATRLDLGSPYCVAMADLDRFKKINDTYGHAAGDTVLHGVAQALRRAAQPDGVACRYGGEEMILFLRGLDDEAGEALCERLRQAVKRLRFQVGRETLTVTVSIGFAECDDPSIPIDRVVHAADEAVYRAKETGRDRVVKGQLPKRLHDKARKTYVTLVAAGKDRRKPK